MVSRGILLAVVVMLASAGCEAKPERDKKAGSATIVVIGNKGVEKTYLVSDAEKMAKLEGFFPNYSKRPTANVAGGWRAGYFVYFDFPKGESVKLVVSPTTHKQVLWSTGQGDFAVEGDFAKFLEGLED